MAHGALVPIIPALGEEYNLSTVQVGLIVSARFIVPPILDVVIGPIMARIGTNRVLVLGGLFMVAAGILGWFSTGFGMLFGARLLEGASFACWFNSRNVYIALNLPYRKRGRAGAFMGTLDRYSYFIAPALGGVLAGFVGIQVPFLLQIGFGIAAIAAILPVWNRPHNDPEKLQFKTLSVNLRRTFTTNHRSLLAFGMFAFATQFLRASRELLVPLQATTLGLNVQEVGFVTAASFGIDALVAPLSGFVMDRFGRKINGAPVLIIMSAIVIALPYINNTAAFVVLALGIGLTNGLGAGMVFTWLGDLAPPKRESEFIALGRATADSGNVVGPIVNSALSMALIAANVFTGVIGLAGAFAMLFGLHKRKDKDG